MSHVHHLTYERKYHERLEDLQGLCEGCHEFTHGKRNRDPLLDVPVKILDRVIEKVYLAGKFSEPDWRQEIIGGYRPPAIGSEDDEWDERRFVFALPDKRKLTYTGPFRFDMGHGNFAGPHQYCIDAEDVSGHGIGPIQYETDARFVVTSCLNAIRCTDLVFAWIDNRECFGTVAEIGVATGMSLTGRGPIIVTASPGYDRELWLGREMGVRHIVAPTAKDAWLKLWQTPDQHGDYYDPYDQEEKEPEEEEDEEEAEIYGSFGLNDHPGHHWHDDK
jgi:hypothetical protein